MQHLAAAAAARRRSVGEAQDLVLLIRAAVAQAAVALAGSVDRVVLVDPADHLTVDRVAPAVPVTVGPVDRADPVDLVVLVTVGPADLATSADPADPPIAGPVDPATSVGPVDPATSAGPVDTATSAGPADPATSAGPADPATSDRGRPMRSAVSGMRHGVTEPHRGVGVRRRRHSGTGPYLRQGAIGTRDPSTIGATTNNRSGIQAKTVGASTSSESGSRCNTLTGMVAVSCARRPPVS